jgi:prevent-host-death family protein
MAQEKALFLASRSTIFEEEQARVRFGEVIHRVYVGKEQVVVEKDGIPVVVILSFPDWKLLLREVKLARNFRLSLSAGLEAERQGLTEEQLEQEMEKIRERVHQEVYG